MFGLRCKGKVAASSPAATQTSWWAEQTEQKAEDQRPLRTEWQMVDEEAALTFTQVQRDRDGDRPRETSFISSAEALSICISGAICSKVIIFFYSWVAKQKPRSRITESLGLKNDIHCDRDCMRYKKLRNSIFLSLQVSVNIYEIAHTYKTPHLNNPMGVVNELTIWFWIGRLINPSNKW